MDKRTLLFVPFIFSAALSACCQTSAISPPAANGAASSAEIIPPPGIVGGDRDAHGCIGSAGYTWCAREQACVRSWELAASKGFANSVEGFDQYCVAKP